MLIIALVLAVIGLASLVAAVVTSNEIIAWVCIGASVIGVLLLIVDALRDRSRRDAHDQDDQAEPVDEVDEPETVVVQDYPDEPADEEIAVEETPAAEAEPDVEPELVPDPEAEHTIETEHKN
ncbi:MAG: hypothetical protein ACRDUB_16305 [Mycobacterium sp.]